MINKKICHTCGKSKSIDEFPFINKDRNKRYNECKLCYNARQRRRWNELHSYSEDENILEKDFLPPEEIKKLLENEKEEQWFALHYKDGKKKCSMCLQFKDVTEYHKNNQKRDGYASRCILCTSIASNKNNAQRHLDKPWKRALSNSKTRAKKLEILNTLTEEDVKILFEQNSVICPVLKIPMQVGSDLQSVPSLDRINPELGYIPGNVRLISFRANSLKQDATIEEIKLILKDLRRIQGQ